MLFWFVVIHCKMWPTATDVTCDMTLVTWPGGRVSLQSRIDWTSTINSTIHCSKNITIHCSKKICSHCHDIFDYRLYVTFCDNPHEVPPVHGLSVCVPSRFRPCDRFNRSLQARGVARSVPASGHSGQGEHPEEPCSAWVEWRDANGWIPSAYVKIAMDGNLYPCMVLFTIKDCDFPVRYVCHYQRVIIGVSQNGDKW